MAQGDVVDTGSRRKVITIGVFVVVVGVIIWQVMGLFGGSSAPPSPSPTAAHPGVPAAPVMQTPRPAELEKSPVLSEREQELMRLQQETEMKYLVALNELQMLKVQKEIAETNKAIASARLDTITSQKGVVDLLAPPPAPQNYAGTLTTPTTSGTGAPEGIPVVPEVTYTVISVTQLESKWSAVLGYKGTLYQVSVGDVLPADSSRVVLIDKSGVVLEKEGTRKKVSLVPII